jgi:hypothetical protein
MVQHGCNVRFVPKADISMSAVCPWRENLTSTLSRFVIPANLECDGLFQGIEAGLRDLRVYHSVRAATDANGTDHFAVHYEWEATRCCGDAVG